MSLYVFLSQCFILDQRLGKTGEEKKLNDFTWHLALTMFDLQGAFIFFLAGIIISLVVFTIELFSVK